MRAGAWSHDHPRRAREPVDRPRRVAQSVWGARRGIMAEYAQGSSVEERLGNGVLSVNLEPPEAPVMRHTEMTYLDRFPAYICFFAWQPEEVDLDRGG